MEGIYDTGAASGVIALAPGESLLAPRSPEGSPASPWKDSVVIIEGIFFVRVDWWTLSGWDTQK